jgi:hypothetical protein
VEISGLNRDWVRVISRRSVVFVVFWSGNQGDVSWGMCLVNTRDRAVDWFLYVCLVYGEDFWVLMGRS